MKVSEQVMRVLRGEHISVEDLAKMVDKAAITRIRGFNRRYFHWLFKIHGEDIQEMQHADLLEIGQGETMMMEPHEACDGHGCHVCGWAGQIGRWITDKRVSTDDSHPDHRRGRTQRRPSR